MIALQFSKYVCGVWVREKKENIYIIFFLSHATFIFGKLNAIVEFYFNFQGDVIILIKSHMGFHNVHCYGHWIYKCWQINYYYYFLFFFFFTTVHFWDAAKTMQSMEAHMRLY